MCKVLRGGGDVLGVDIMTSAELVVYVADRQQCCLSWWMERVRRRRRMQRKVKTSVGATVASNQTQPMLYPQSYVRASVNTR